MQSLSLTDAEALRPYLALLQERGVNVDRYLDEERLSQEMIFSSGCKVTKVQAYQFLEACADVEEMPYFGYEVGTKFGLEQMGKLETLLTSSSSLGEGLHLFCRQLSRWVGGATAWLERHGDRVWLKNTGTDALPCARRIANQNSLLLSTHIIRLVANQDWLPDQIIAPSLNGSSAHDIEFLANAELSFSDTVVGISFPAEFLSRPLPIRNLNGSSDTLSEPPAPFHEALGKAIESQLPYRGVSSLEIAAEMCGLSPRSLQRRLAEEGLSFRDLLTRSRMKIAWDILLSEPKVTAAQLAHHLDYSSPTNFIRAFRRFWGLTPGELTKQFREKGIQRDHGSAFPS